MLDRRIHRRRPIRSKRSPPPLTNNRRAALLAPLIVVVVEATQNDADGSHRWSQLRPSSSSSFFSFPTASHRQQQQLDNRKIRKLFTFLPHAIKMAPDVDKFPFKKWKTKQKQKKTFHCANVSVIERQHWNTPGHIAERKKTHDTQLNDATQLVQDLSPGWWRLNECRECWSWAIAQRCWKRNTQHTPYTHTLHTDRRNDNDR